MTFRLTAQCDEVDPRLPEQLYRSYIENNRWRIPESALAVTAHPKWAGGSESESPHDSYLVSFNATCIGERSSELTLLLMKERHSEPHFYLEINYSGLFALEIPEQQAISHYPCAWLCDEFLYFDAYPDWEIKDKFFTHQIEWLGKRIWRITASEISVQWSFFEHQIDEGLAEAEKRVRPVIKTIGAFHAGGASGTRGFGSR